MIRRISRALRGALAVGSLACLPFLPGCTDEGSAVHPGDSEELEPCPHFLPGGIEVEESGTLLYDEYQGFFRGEINLGALEQDHDLVTAWLSPDSTLMIPPGVECANHWLAWAIGDSTVVAVSASPSAKWGVRLRGLRDGATTLRLRPVHFDDGIEHAHFISREITVRAGDGGAGEPLSGVRLAGPSGELAKERRGAVHGGVSVPAGALSVPIEARILGANAEPVEPGTFRVQPHLSWSIEDSTIARLDEEGTGETTLRVRGLAAGATTLRATITLRDRVEYESSPIPLVVGPGHAPLGVQGIAVRLNSTLAASWNYNPDLTPNQATGALWLRPGALTREFEVEFLGAYDAVSEEREVLSPADDHYELAWEVEDPTVAMLSRVAGARFALEGTGGTIGATRVRAILRYDGFDEYISGWMAIEVAADPVGVPDFTLTRNGVWLVIWKDGAFGDGCAHTQNPGYLGAREGELTEHNLFRLLNASCQRVLPDEATHSLQYEFADPGIAKALAYPEHGHAGMDFHLAGLAAGETTLRIRLLEGAETVLVTPPISVRVSAAAN